MTAGETGPNDVVGRCGSTASQETGPNELHMRLAIYGVAVSATGMLAAPASAQFTTYTPGPPPLTTTVNGTPILFDFLNGAASLSGAAPSGPGQFALMVNTNSFFRSGPDDTQFTYRSGAFKDLANPQGKIIGSKSYAWEFSRGSTIGNSLPQHTGTGVLVGYSRPLSPEAPGGTASFGSWNVPQNGYLGFEFSNGGNSYFGWANVTLADSGTPEFTLNSFGYDTIPGAPIEAGETDTPDGNPLLLLVAGGAAALAAYRSRRRGADGVA